MERRNSSIKLKPWQNRSTRDMCVRLRTDDACVRQCISWNIHHYIFRLEYTVVVSVPYISLLLCIEWNSIQHRWALLGPHELPLVCTIVIFFTWRLQRYWRYVSQGTKKNAYRTSIRTFFSSNKLTVQSGQNFRLKFHFGMKSTFFLSRSDAYMKHTSSSSATDSLGNLQYLHRFWFLPRKGTQSV